MYTWNIDPVLFDLGPLEIRYYGLFFALALFLAYLLARYMCKQKKLSLELLDSLSIYLILGLIIGARLGHILFYELDYYLTHPELILQVWKGGLASHGAAIGLIIALGLFIWRHKKVKFLDYADIIAIVATIPIALIRIGNFFNSEIVGRPWDGPWSIVFERVDDVARHPSQIYEFLFGALVFALLMSFWSLRKKLKIKPGFFVGALFISYFILRFLVEYFKEYPLHESFFNLTTGQILSIPFVLLGLYIFIVTQKKN